MCVLVDDDKFSLENFYFIFRNEDVLNDWLWNWIFDIG